MADIGTFAYPPLSEHPSFVNTTNLPVANIPDYKGASFGPQHSQSSSPTTPRPRGTTSHMAFYPQSGGASAGMPNQSASFNGFSHLNGHGAVAEPIDTPQIYTAVYSSVPVYEMDVKGIAVMRRRSDSWLNATQILKVAGIEKGKRTKILDKEILTGEHEKVQGGYGKYQGTWINYQRGVEFCRQYGVEPLLRPLLEHDMGQDGISLAGQGGVETPTKEQALAAQRKRMFSTSLDGSKSNGQSANGTFFKKISSTASNAVAAISKARFDSPNPRPGSRPAISRKQSGYNNSQETHFPGGSQQSLHSVASDSSLGGPFDSAYGSGRPSYQSEGMNPEFQEPPRKRIRPSSSQDVMQLDDSAYESALRDGSPSELEMNESFMQRQQYGLIDDMSLAKPIPVQPLPTPTSADAIQKQSWLTSLFADSTRHSQPESDLASHAAFEHCTGDDFSIPLDINANTAMHWAAALAKIPELKMMIDAGANIFRVNTGGETALDKALGSNNNFIAGTFPELLELLGSTIEMPDVRGRTILHKLALTCAVKNRTLSSKYYLESLLEFVVRQGSAPNSQSNSFSTQQPSQAAQPSRPITLASFIHNIVNAQDKSGDTALNIAARAGNRSIIQQLLEIRADPNIPNRVGLRPTDFGIEGEGIEPPASNANYISQVDEGISNRIVGETSKDLITSISHILNETSKEFGSELKNKQLLIESTHAELREASRRLSDERRKLEALQNAATERSQLRQKGINLRQLNEDERARLQQTKSRLNGAMSDLSGPLTMEGVRRVGDADKDIAIQINPVMLPQTQGQPIIPAQHQYLAQLPSTAAIQAQTRAYQANNEFLRKRVQGLKNNSAELEAKYRKVVELCTQEKDVDKKISRLLLALESEGGAIFDLKSGRTRDFLNNVRELIE